MFHGVFKTFLLRRKVFLLAFLLVIPSSVFAESLPLCKGELEGVDKCASDNLPPPPPPYKGGESPSDKPVDIGEVRVEGRAEYESLEGAGAFTTVIRPDRFYMQTKTTPEILSESVGVDVTSLGGEGQLSTVSIRGSSAEQVAVFLDGVRINSSLFGSVDFATIPIQSIDRIEVIRGSSSARFGTDAIGGVINIVTKKAGAKRAIDLKLTGGSFHTLRTHESWSEPHEKWNLVLAHSHRSTGGDFTFRSATVTLEDQPIGPSRTYTRIHNKSIAEDVLGKIRIDLSKIAHIDIANNFFWTDRQVPGTEEETTVLYPANPLQAEEEIFRDTSNVLLTLDEFFTPSLSWQLGNTFFMNNDHFTDPSPAVGNAIDVTYVAYSPEAHTQWMHAVSGKHLSIASTFRYQYRYDYSNNSSPYAGASLMGRHTRNTNAIFVEEVLGFFGDKLLFIPQGRIENASGRRTRISGKAGIIEKPFDWIDIKTNIQNSFRYPNFGELYYPDQGYLRGNPDLKDESAWGFDLGFILHPKFGSLEFSYFQNRISNQILFVPVSAFTIQPVNTFSVFTQGIEVSASLDPIKYFHIDANFTWLDAHYSGSNRRLPGRPEYKFNTHVEGKIKPVILFGTLQYIGSYPVNTANSVWISDHLALNLGTTLEFSKYIFATAEVKDVTNVQMYDARAFPLPRRSYWVSVGAKI